MTTRRPCTVYVDNSPDSIRGDIYISGQSFVLHMDGSRVDLAFGTTRLERGGFDGSLLVLKGSSFGASYSVFVESPKELLAELRRARPARPLGEDLEKHFSASRGMKVALLVVVLLGVMGAGLYFGSVWVFRSTIGVAVDNVPLEWEEELGRYAAKDFLSKGQVCSDEEMVAAVEEMVERLNEAVPNAPYKFRVKILNTPDVNAFALPGGYIFVNSGLIEKARSPEEVAGVVAHEMQHVLMRHGIRNVMSRASIGLLVALFFGDVQGLAGFVVGAASELAALSFSREQEEEADAGGLELLYLARIDPAGMPSFFEVLIEKEEEVGISMPSFLSSHPETMERIAALKAAIEVRGKGEVVPFTFDWGKAKGSCSPVAWNDPDAQVPLGGEKGEEGPSEASQGGEAASPAVGDAKPPAPAAE